MAAKKPAPEGLTQERIDSIVDRVLGEFRKAPAVRTEDRTARYSREDLNQLALDNGLSKESLEERLRAEDQTRSHGGRFDSRPSVNRAMRLSGFNPQTGKRELGLDENVGMRFASYVNAITEARGNRAVAVELAKRNGADATVVRALGESTLAGGGALVQREISDDFFELLYASTAYLQGGPKNVQMQSGVLDVSGGATGASATWVGENAEITKSEPTFRQATLSLKKIAVLVPISNDLRMHAAHNVDAFVRDDIVAATEVAIDSAMIRGSGTAFTPTGLKNEADQSFASTGTTVATITADLTRMQRLLADNKIKARKAGYLMSPRSFFYLMSLRDGNNNLVFAPELAQGRLQGKPVFVTHNIPDNLSTDKSEVYLCDFEHEMFGSGVGDRALRIDQFDGGTYTVSGTATSGISNDQTIIRLIAYADRASRQLGKNTVLLTTVGWGA